MSKKQSPPKRRNLSARQHEKSKPPVVQADVDVTDDGSVVSDENTLSGDTQGLSEIEDATFESAKELAEEGQYLEAEVVGGVQNAPPADAGPVNEVPEDDVPPEYLDPEREQ